MAEGDEEVGSQPRGESPALSCPSCCLQLLLSVLTLFDARTNRNVQLFQCQHCRKHVWEDEIG